MLTDLSPRLTSLDDIDHRFEAMLSAFFGGYSIKEVQSQCPESFYCDVLVNDTIRGELLQVASKAEPRKTFVVGMRFPDLTPMGVYQMTGNVIGFQATNTGLRVPA